MKKDFDGWNVENEIAALAGGDLGSSRIQSSSKPGFVTPADSIANSTFVSSTQNDLIDSLQTT